MHHHIKYSELFTKNDEPRNLLKEDFLFSNVDEDEISLFYKWPRYEVSRVLNRQWAESYPPVLLLHGEYDHSSKFMYSLYAKRILEKKSDHVHFVGIPFGHNQSPMSKHKRPGCITDIVINFLENPKMVEVDQCLDKMDMDFEGLTKDSKSLIKEAFDTKKLWGDLEEIDDIPDSLTWEGYVLFATFIVLVVIVSAVFILLVIKTTRRTEQTRGANHYFQQ